MRGGAHQLRCFLPAPRARAGSPAGALPSPLSPSVLRGGGGFLGGRGWRMADAFFPACGRGELETVRRTIAHASHALKSIGIVASPSRLYSEVYDSECRAQGIATPRRIVQLLPRVVISKGRVG